MTAQRRGKFFSLAMGVLASVAALFVLADRAEACETGDQCYGIYVGYVGARGPVLRNGKKVWVERLGGPNTPESELAGDFPEDAQVIGVPEFRQQQMRFNEVRARSPGAEVLPRAAYESGHFFTSDDQPILSKPPLQPSTKFVLVAAKARTIMFVDLILFELSFDPMEQRAETSGSFLVGPDGKILTWSGGVIAYQSDFVPSRGRHGCPGEVGDALTFESCLERPLTLLSPIRGAEVLSSSHWIYGPYGERTQADGSYRLGYTYAGGSDANARDWIWVFLRYGDFDPRIKFGSLNLQSRLSRGGVGETMWDVQNVAIETAYFVGTGQLVNELRPAFRPPEGAPFAAGPIPIDDATNHTEFEFIEPPQLTPEGGVDGGAVPDGGVPPPPPPDLVDRGLLKTINRADLSDTDVYVYDLGGNLLLERLRLRSNETDGLVCDAPGVCTLPPGNYEAKFNVQGTLENIFTDASIRVLLVNRATGYIGTGTGTAIGSGVTFPFTQTFPFIRIDETIKLRPPNLSLVAERAREENPDDLQTIGFEGSGLTRDQKIVITTEWTDWDGSPLPPLPTSAGFTGRLARVVDTNQLAPDVVVEGQGNALGTFSISPGRQTQVIKLPVLRGQGDEGYFYIHISGQPISRNPDFASLGAGLGKLTHRPARYVPFKVPIFDKPEDWNPEWDPRDYYKFVYRPEMQFSLLTLNVHRIDATTGSGTTVNTLDPNNPALTDAIQSIKVVFDLFQEQLPELDRFGYDRTYTWTVGDGNPREAHIGSNGSVTFTEGTGPIEPSELVGLRLVQSGDEGNVLADYGLTLTFQAFPEGDILEVSADSMKAELEVAVKYGVLPVDEGATIKWELLSATHGGEFVGGGNTFESTTNKDGFATAVFQTVPIPGARYEFRATLEEFKLGGVGKTMPTKPQVRFIPVEVVPGDISQIEIVSPANGTADFPADGTSRIEVHAIFRDSRNNLVADGTPILWQPFGIGKLIEEDVTTTGGTASAVMVAPVASGLCMVGISGGRAQPKLVPLQAIQVEGQVTERPGREGRTVPLQATFVTTDNRPVAMDTPVLWTTSNGFIEGGDLTDAQGVATATLTVDAESDLSDAIVFAAVGSVAAAYPVALGSTTQLVSLKITHSMLIAPVTQGLDSATEVRDLFVEGDEVTQEHPIQAFARTPVTVRGPAGRHARIALGRDLGRCLELQGTAPVLVNGVPTGEGEVEIPGQPGTYSSIDVTLRLKPGKKFSDCGGVDLDGGSEQADDGDPCSAEGRPYIEAPVSVNIADDSGSFDTEPEATVCVGLVDETLARYVGAVIWDFVKGAAIGNPTTRAGIVGDIVASIFIWGDIRDLIRFGLAVNGNIDEDPSLLSAVLSLAGIFSIPIADEVFAVLKPLIRRFPSTSAGRSTVSIVVKEIDELPAVAQLAEYELHRPLINQLSKLDAPNLNLIAGVLDAPQTVRRLSYVYRELGEVGGVVFVQTLTRVAGDAAFGPAVARRMIDFLGHVDMDRAVLTEFSRLSALAADELMLTLPIVCKHLDVRQLALTMSRAGAFKGNVAAGYGRLEMLKDLAYLAPDTPGIDHLLSVIKNSGKNSHGFKFELQVAVQAKRNGSLFGPGCTLLSLSDPVTTAIGNTDIDIQLLCGPPGNRVAKLVQVKRSLSALRSLPSIQDWVAKVLPRAGNQRSNLIYVVPTDVFGKVYPSWRTWFAGVAGQQPIRLMAIAELGAPL